MSGKTDFSAEWFANYMARAGQEVSVESMKRFARGTSRQTWFISYRDKAGYSSRVTLRTDHPSGSGDPTSLEQEFGVYQRLGRTNVPHARALLWESDLDAAPRPFYLRETVEGSWQIPGYDQRTEAGALIRLDAAREHIRALALVHDADWRGAGFTDLIGAPADVDDAVPFYVRTQLARFEAFGGEPSPLLLEVSDTILDAAKPAKRLCLCKGTNGLGEEVFRDGKIVAMSDWEEVLIGDPASDLAMVQGFTEPIIWEGKRLWDLDIAVDFYNSVASVPVPMENVRFYQLVRLFGRMVMFAYTSKVVRSSASATVRQSWTATEVQHVVKRALAGALGLMPPLNPAIFDELNHTVDGAEGRS